MVAYTLRDTCRAGLLDDVVGLLQLCLITGGGIYFLLAGVSIDRLRFGLLHFVFKLKLVRGLDDVGSERFGLADLAAIDVVFVVVQVTRALHRLLHGRMVGTGSLDLRKRRSLAMIEHHVPIV